MQGIGVDGSVTFCAIGILTLGDFHALLFRQLMGSGVMGSVWKILVPKTHCNVEKAYSLKTLDPRHKRWVSTAVLIEFRIDPRLEDLKPPKQKMS